MMMSSGAWPHLPVVIAKTLSIYHPQGLRGTGTLEGEHRLFERGCLEPDLEVVGEAVALLGYAKAAEGHAQTPILVVQHRDGVFAVGEVFEDGHDLARPVRDNSG